MFELFQYKFFVNAMLAAFFSALTCGFIGTYIVSRRIVFISGGISHTSFGGVGVGYYLGIPPLLGAAVFSILSAVLVEALSRKSELREDSLIGMMWSFGMAVGIIFIFITPGYAADLMSYLFGGILTVSGSELRLMAALAILIVLFFTLFFKEILFVAFDENYARTQGVPTRALNYVLLGLAALTIVVNIRVVGIILVISMLTIPQAAANLLTRDFKRMMIYSSIFAFLASVAGLFFSFEFNIPSGAAIIFFSIAIFIVIKTITSLTIKWKLKKTLSQ